MIQIGKYNRLTVVKSVSFGLYLSPADGPEEILLPIKYVKEGTAIGDILDIFVYNDSEGRPIATTLIPFATVGQFAFLKVVETVDFGAFMDLGIAKDVFIPKTNQAVAMRKDNSYVVYLDIDQETGRIVATSKWNKFIEKEHLEITEGDVVQLLIAEQTDMGFKAIINQKYLGLLYKNEIFEPVHIGDKKRGFIKKIREENKIDLSLQEQGYEHIEDSKHQILHLLEINNGFLALTDKSSSEEVYAKVKLSKKAFKKTIGGLYKERLIDLTEKGIQLL